MVVVGRKGLFNKELLVDSVCEILYDMTAAVLCFFFPGIDRLSLMEPKETKNLRFDFTTDDIDFHTSEEEFEEEEFVEEEEEYEYEDEEYDSEAEDLVSERNFINHS